MLLNKKVSTEKIYILFFIVFLFFSAIFCNISKVNLLFHVSLILFIGSQFLSSKARSVFFSDHDYLKGLILPALLLFYFALTNLWSQNPENITATLKHSLYLLTFLCLYRQAEKMGYKKHVMGAVFFGMVLLSILTLVMVDKSHIFIGRLNYAFPWAPDNVIDLGGYFVVGIFCGLIFVRETGKTWLYMFIPLLFISLLLTQSRGPLISFIAAFSILFIIKPDYKKHHLLYGLIIIFMVISVVFMTNFSDVFINRIEDLYRQSFIRLGIWQHTIDVANEKFIWGWGYDKSLTFVNSIGQHISTTHTIYLASLLKGGVIGFVLLMTVIGYGFLQIPKHFRSQQKGEISLFLFSIIYYLSQGMFIIGNPQEFWVLFWFPLAIILSSPLKKQYSK